MNPTSPTTPEPELKPHWQTPAAAAGVMAAGLMVGRKSTLGLALGMAAVAGARWLLARQRERGCIEGTAMAVPISPKATAPVPVIERPKGRPPVIEGEFEMVTEPAVEKAKAPTLSTLEMEALQPVIIYEQQGEMPSCNVATEGSVWFALFNEAPRELHDTPPADVAPTHVEVNEIEPLPESFFSEAPGDVGPNQESPAKEEAVAVVSADKDKMPEDALLHQELLPKSEDEADQPMDLFSRAAQSEATPAKDEGRPVSVLHRIVARAPREAAEPVPRPISSGILPQKRSDGEAPKAWIVPAPEWQTNVQPKKTSDAPLPLVHRAILPHEMLAQAKGTRRWPLVTAIMLVFFAAIALVVFGGGLDTSMIKEWKSHWRNLDPTATAPGTHDVSHWTPKDKAKMVESPVVDR